MTSRAFPHPSFAWPRLPVSSFILFILKAAPATLPHTHPLSNDCSPQTCRGVVTSLGSTVHFLGFSPLHSTAAGEGQDSWLSVGHTHPRVPFLHGTTSESPSVSGTASTGAGRSPELYELISGT